MRAAGRGRVMNGRPMGDPGLFGGIWGAVKGAAGSLVSGGNPLAGAARGAVSGFRGSSSPGTGTPARVPFTDSQIAGVMSQMGVGRQQAIDMLNFRSSQGLVPGTAGGINFPGFQGPGVGIGTPFGRLSAGEQPQLNGKIGCPSGYRPNKSDYFLKDGTFVAAGTRCVKVRRRNPLNPRALDRAMSRMTSAKRAAKKIGRISIRKKC